MRRITRGRSRSQARTGRARWFVSPLLLILVLAAGLRLIHLDAPVVGKHSWRQADTAAMARNFVQEESDIRYPRIDWRGASSGHVESEFPIYSALLAGIYRVVGIHEAAGRALSLVFSVLTVFLVHRLALEICGRSIALWSAFFYAVLPLPVFFGRAIMPESLMVATATAAVLCFLLWTRSDRSRWIIGSALCLAVTCLIKPPMLYLGLPLAGLALRKHGRRAWLRQDLWSMIVFVVLSLALWYGHAHRLKEETGLTFGVWAYGSDKWGNWDLVFSGAFWRTIALRLTQFYLAIAGVPLVLAGARARPRGPDERVLSLWLLATLVFAVIVARGTFVHDYYLLPVSVPLSVYLGKGTDAGLKSTRPRWLRGLVLACVLGVTAVSLSLAATSLRKESSETPLIHLAESARSRIPRADLVVAAESGNPTLLYLAERKGWLESPAALTEETRRRLAADGARWLLGRHDEFRKRGGEANLNDILRNREAVLFDSGDYFIVRLP